MATRACHASCVRCKPFSKSTIVLKTRRAMGIGCLVDPVGAVIGSAVEVEVEDVEAVEEAGEIEGLGVEAGVVVGEVVGKVVELGVGVGDAGWWLT